MISLNYELPQDLTIQKINELVYGIECFDKKENQKIYNLEKTKIINAK